LQKTFKHLVICGAERPVDDSSFKAPSNLIGPANETYVKVNGCDVLALLDTGSQVSCISRKFYETCLSHIEIKPLETLLKIEGIGGSYLPYSGYVEIELSLPGKVLGDIKSLLALLLVTDDTKYNEHCPVLLGTNVICRCFELHDDFVNEQLPTAWKVAFQSMVLKSQESYNGTPVTVNKSVEIPALSSIVVNGQHCGLQCNDSTPVLIEATLDSSLPGGLLVTPAIYNKSDINEKIPVSIVNTSQKAVTIPLNCILCFAFPVSVCSQQMEESSISSSQIHEAFPLTDLTDHQRRLVYQCLENHKNAFSWSDWDLGHYEGQAHRIHLKEDKPFKEKYRRIPPAMVEEVREHLKNMVDAGVIQQSSSPYASAAVFVRKPTGELRFVTDYRKLNNNTIIDSHYLPRIDDTFDRLAGASWFSTLDLKSGYWQLDMHPDDRQYTAFTAGCLGFYEWTRMPMGLVNSAATFQRVMEQVMGSLNLKTCLLYLDDIIIFSNTWETHLQRLDQALSRLEEAGLKLKPSKCCLFQREIKYLGHILSEKGIATDPAKIEKVMNWPIPTDRKQLHRYLAFCGYYRRFIKNFSQLAFPLQKLLRGVPENVKKVKKKRNSKSKVIYPPFEWKDEQQTAFDKLKEAMTSAPVLAFADFDRSFTLEIDGSSHGLGAILSQHVEGKLHPIAYASRGLTSAESRYPAHKLEFLAMKWAISEKFYDYLYGREFTLLTDNNPLVYVMTSAKLDATGLRWVAALSSFNFSIRYRPGKMNAAADALSRMDDFVTLSVEDVKAICDGAGREELVSTVCMSSQALPDCSTSFQGTPPDWSKLQMEDDVINTVIKSLQKDNLNSDLPEVRHLWRQRKRLRIENDILYRSCLHQGVEVKQLVLPSLQREEALRMLHDDMGHFGRDRVLDLLKSRFYWPFMKDYVSAYVSKCENCLKRKKVEPIAELVPITTSSPMELVSMDFLCLESSVGGYSNILVLTDHFTRYAMATPTRNQSAKTTAKALVDLFVNHYGMPQRLHSDNGANFVGNVITEMCKLLGIERSTTTPYHPMGNGQCEKFNSSLLNMLGTLPAVKKSRWVEYVKPLVHAYNCTKNIVTGYSPFQLMFGRTPRLPIDDAFGLVGPEDSPTVSYVTDLRKKMEESYKIARDNMEKNQQKAKRYYDLKVRGNAINSGDRVLIKKTVFPEGRHKLSNRWEDQVYVVLRQLDDLPVFEIQPEQGKGRKKRLHRNNLLPIGTRNPQTASSDDSSEDEAEEEVQDLLRPPAPTDRPPPVTAKDTPEEKMKVESDSLTPLPPIDPSQQLESRVVPKKEPEASPDDTEEDQTERQLPRRSGRRRQLPARFQSEDFILSRQGQSMRDEKLLLLSKLLDLFN